MTALRLITATVRQRSTVYGDWGFDRKLSLGKGIIALFSGPSGTGKTMAAEISRQRPRPRPLQDRPLAVVSKYIGETEKNLERIFAEAQDSDAILFFDEADALFGKRSEVQGRPRPLRQHRDRLPAAADGGVRAAWSSWPAT